MLERPLIAALPSHVADLLAGGDVPELAPYRPDRFTCAGVSGRAFVLGVDTTAPASEMADSALAASSAFSRRFGRHALLGDGDLAECEILGIPGARNVIRIPVQRPRKR